TQATLPPSAKETRPERWSIDACQLALAPSWKAAQLFCKLVPTRLRELSRVSIGCDGCSLSWTKTREDRTALLCLATWAVAGIATRTNSIDNKARRMDRETADFAMNSPPS